MQNLKRQVSSFEIQASGFTLIELLVVIAIIGILAAIIIANLASAKARGRDAQRIGNISSISIALEAYYQANNTYPPGRQSASNNSGDILTPALVPIYLPVVPQDPSCSPSLGNCHYDYQALVNSHGTACSSVPCGYYHLGASLEQSNSSALGNDADMCSDSASGCNIVNISGAFEGSDLGPCYGSDGAQLSTGHGYCYDLIP